ncbi:two-component sensor histidine kinase [Catellatospora sp. IY07-71]|uniref:sensor histidine kinase n=1 Tax=Catellatospora sp. IY07-71 TaxID=2728827 RepID=UPI001BB309B5|nr:sensor histidine kinase [Catellatospora sp. IY07-71]BCJ73518.1 two-component sensor histidine kinase [Catellatospora sp. IY07-71]
MTWDHPHRRHGRKRLIPLLIAAIQMIGVTFASHFPANQAPATPRPLDLLAYALLAGSALAMWLVHVRVELALAAVTALTATYLALGYPWGPFFLAFLFMLILAVVLGRQLSAALTAAAGYALFVWLTARRGIDPLSWHSLVAAVVIIGVLLFAQVVRANRDRIVEQRRRRAGDERLRMAREVHDVVAHHISLINVQAGVALHLLDDDPEQARTALAAIKQASRDTLRELRQTLGVLRGVDEQAPRSPAPSLDRLDELVERFAAAGLRVEIRVTGRPRPLPTAVDLAAYRIVQESLTNVHRHAGVDGAEVTVGYDTDEIVLDITDRGRGGDAAEGNGLSGIRERAASLGGTVAIGPRPEGGFTVCAVLPTGGDS